LRPAINAPATPTPIKVRKGVGVGKNNRADRRDGEEHGLHASRPEAIEPCAEGKLKRAECQEQDGREHAKVGCGQAELIDERTGDKCIDRAIEITEIVTGSEWQQHRGNEIPGARPIVRFTCLTCWPAQDPRHLLVWIGSQAMGGMQIWIV
jgi:hypothetical protein